MRDGHYYIGTGAKENFFTLRYHFEEVIYTNTEHGPAPSGVSIRDYHVRNLSIDRETALSKARELTGSSLNANFEVRPIGERKEVDWSIFQGGKYQGKSIHEVVELDREYLIWASENLENSKGYSKTLELARSLVAHDLDERQTERDNVKEVEEKKAKKRKRVLKPLVETMRDGKGGFRDSIADDLEKGQVPRGRGLHLTIEILSKSKGRMNSKAFNVEEERLEKIFEGLEN